MELVPGNVFIVHDGIGPASLSQVPQTSLGQHYRAGWRPANAGDLPQPEPEPAPPPAETRKQAAKAASKDEGDK
jgi:hypothetical protein